MDDYGRFYSLLKRMPYDGDREDLKRTLVRVYTGNRTDSLHEMTATEYDACCAKMEASALIPKEEGPADLERRKWRRVCLVLMKQAGVDTGSWKTINDYCKSKRIAGKAFALLDTAELEQLSRKLRKIIVKR